MRHSRLSRQAASNKILYFEISPEFIFVTTQMPKLDYFESKKQCRKSICQWIRNSYGASKIKSVSTTLADLASIGQKILFALRKHFYSFLGVYIANSRHIGLLAQGRFHELKSVPLFPRKRGGLRKIEHIILMTNITFSALGTSCTFLTLSDLPRSEF